MDEDDGECVLDEDDGECVLDEDDGECVCQICLLTRISIVSSYWTSCCKDGEWI